jgi:hypothetical protein
MTSWRPKPLQYATSRTLSSMRRSVLLFSLRKLSFSACKLCDSCLKYRASHEPCLTLLVLRHLWL